MDLYDDDERYDTSQLSDELPDTTGGGGNDGGGGTPPPPKNFPYTADVFAQKVYKYCGRLGVAIDFDNKFACKIDNSDGRNESVERYRSNVFQCLSLDFLTDSSRKSEVEELTELLYDPFKFAIILSSIINEGLDLDDAYKQLSNYDESNTIDNTCSIFPEEALSMEKNKDTDGKEVTDIVDSPESDILANPNVGSLKECFKNMADTDNTHSDKDEFSSVIKNNTVNNTPIMISKINHFSDNDLAEIKSLHKHYHFDVPDGDLLKTGYESIIHDIEQIGHNNMLRFIYEIKQSPTVDKHHLLEFFIFVVFSYTTPLCLEFFLSYFNHGDTLNSNKEYNALMPYYSGNLKPVLDKYVENTDFNDDNDKDWFKLLCDYFCSLPGVTQVVKSIDWLDKYRNSLKYEGLRPTFIRFLKYYKTERNRDDKFETDPRMFLLIIHMVYLFDHPMVFLDATRSIYIDANRNHLDRIFFKEEFCHYNNCIEDNRPIDEYDFRNI